MPKQSSSCCVFGYEDPTSDTDSQPELEKYKRLRLDTASLTSTTGCQWLTWPAWLEILKASRRRMVNYCEKNLPGGMTTPDWYTTIWEQGRSVRQSHGYRLRPLPQYQGYTQSDGFVRSLENNTARLLLADEWAERWPGHPFYSTFYMPVRSPRMENCGEPAKSDKIGRR